MRYRARSRLEEAEDDGSRSADDPVARQELLPSRAQGADCVPGGRVSE